MTNLGEKRLGIKRESMIKLYDAEGNVPLHSAVHSGDIKVLLIVKLSQFNLMFIGGGIMFEIWCRS